MTPRNKPRTVEEYRRLWKLHLLPRFGTLRLDEVTPDRVLQMKHDVAGKQVAANRALQQLAAGYAFAAKMQWTTENPASERTIDGYLENPEARALQPRNTRGSAPLSEGPSWTRLCGRGRSPQSDLFS